MAPKKKNVAVIPPATKGEAVPAYNMVEMEAKLSAALGGRKVSLAKLVTVPVVRHKEGDTVMIKVTGPMRIGKSMKEIGADGKERSREPATLVDCINLATGEPAAYICTAVVKGNLDDQYPDNGYVGRSFAIYKGVKGEGKQYRDMQIAEITVG